MAAVLRSSGANPFPVRAAYRVAPLLTQSELQEQGPDSDHAP